MVCVSEEGTTSKTFVFSKDNIPFHTIIWPAIICGLNHAKQRLTDSDEVRLPQMEI